MNLIFLSALLLSGALATITQKDYHQYNYNLKNDRHVPTFGVSTQDISKLALKCDILFTPGELVGARHQAQPIVVDDIMYISGNYGLLKAIRLHKGGCTELWSFSVGVEVFGYTSDIPVQARVTPTYYEKTNGNNVKKGKIISIAPGFILTLPIDKWFSAPFKIFQIDAETGTLDWSKDLTDPTKVTEALMSSWSAPTIVDGVAYFGLSSAINIFPAPTLNFFLQTFTGSSYAYPYQSIGLVYAIDVANDGVVVWRRQTIPTKPSGYDGKWFSGGGVWSSGPSVVEGKVLFGAGQFYSVTNETENCLSTPEVNAQLGTTFKGETGGGLIECFQAAENHLASLGITEPLLTGSSFALDAHTGEVAWSTNLIGADTWLVPCGSNPTAGAPGCDTPVPGPDWDANGGQTPSVIKFRGKNHVFSHTKGGLIVIMDPSNGNVVAKWDICHGSTNGGIHFGFSYDKVTHTLLVPCAAGNSIPDLAAEPLTSVVTVSTLANGDKVCQTGYMNAIDLDTEKLIWQAVPAGANSPNDFSICTNPASVNVVDTRFKYNIGVTKQFKDLVDPSVSVVYYKNSVGDVYPSFTDYRTSTNNPGIVGNGMVFWTTAGGKVYVTDVRNGNYLHDVNCEVGGLYGAGVTISGKRIMFGCGDGIAPGSKVRVFER